VLRLQEIPEQASSAKPPCADVVQELAGYEIFLSSDGTEASIVHQKRAGEIDEGCPLGYRIGAFHLSPEKDGRQMIAVLIHTETYGFEGPDYRYHAFLIDVE
jgi:predicted secreted protein